MLGIDFSMDKIRCSSTVTILGVENNLASGYLAVAPKRRAELLLELTALANGSELLPGQAAKLKGKLQFVASHFQGRFGRSFLRAFSARQ